MPQENKDLEIECLDLVLDEDDPLRCHLIKSGEGIINSGTRYMGEDGEVHIRWDKPREHDDWPKVQISIDDLTRYLSTKVPSK